MSGSTEELRRKISGAGDLGAVVRSMKALAASSIGQYERAVQSLADYRHTVELGLTACFRQTGSIPSALHPGSPDGAVGIVVFGSEQGLVGRFNEVLVEFVAHTFGAGPGPALKIWAVGERVQALLAETQPSPPRLLPVPLSIAAITPLVGRILVEIEEALAKRTVREIHLFHNQPKAGAAYEPAGRKLLPFDRDWQRRFCATPWPNREFPQVMGETGPVLQAFIREYLFILIFQACAESLASENAARLAAMQRAEKNIQGIVEDLNRTFHRVRQEAIDEELFDVISGYEATSKAITPPLSSERMPAGIG